MKKRSNNESILKFTEFFKDFIVISSSSIMVYIVARFVGLAIINRQTANISFSDLFLKLFSTSMFPVLFSYAVIIFIAYSLYKKTKKAMIILHEQELKKEKEKAIIQTSQKLSALMIQYISGYNSEIQKWLMLKKEQGSMPQVVAEASSNINQTLQNFSRLAFIAPYAKVTAENAESHTTYLNTSLKQIELKEN